MPRSRWSAVTAGRHRDTADTGLQGCPILDQFGNKGTDFTFDRGGRRRNHLKNGIVASHQRIHGRDVDNTVPCTRGMFSLTWAITCRAVSMAALVISTETPRSKTVFVRGLTWIQGDIQRHPARAE